MEKYKKYDVKVHLLWTGPGLNEEDAIRMVCEHIDAAHINGKIPLTHIFGFDVKFVEDYELGYIGEKGVPNQAKAREP